MDGGAWWAAVYGVEQNWTRLSDLAAAAAARAVGMVGIVDSFFLFVSFRTTVLSIPYRI